MISINSQQIWLQAGNILQILLPVSVLFPLIKKREPFDAWLQMIKLLMVVLAITYILKYCIVEPRPTGAPHSFPSGHTASAFTAIFFVGFRYGWWYLFCFLPFGVITAASRVIGHQHWLHDVVASTILAAVCALFIVRKKRS